MLVYASLRALIASFLAFLLQAVLSFEAWMIAQSLHPSFPKEEGCFGSVVSRRFESHFRHLFSTISVDSSVACSNISHTGEGGLNSIAVTAAWVLLQSVYRLHSVMSFDTLVHLLPVSLWGLVAQAVDIVKPTVIAAVRVHSLVQSNVTATTAATSASADPVADSRKANPAILERRLMEILSHTATSVFTINTYPTEVQMHDELLQHYILVWLTIITLPLANTHLDNTTTIIKTTTTTSTDTTSAGNKRPLPQDAESFDFFAENDSAEEDSNLRGGGRKRLRKKNESVIRSQQIDVVHPFVPSLSSGGRNSDTSSGEKVFVLFEQQRQFIVDHSLQGCIVSVLIHQLHNNNSASTTTTTSSTRSCVNRLCSAIESVLALLEHSTAVDADCWTVTLETALGKFLGKFLLLYSRIQS